MKLTILLTTYNRRQWLAHTFPSLLTQDFPSDQYEIVVVVDGSTDGTAEFLRSLPARCAVNIIEQPNAGQVAAQNVGLQAARGELVLPMDDDVLCTPGLVREHVAAHARGGPFVVFGPLKLAPESAPTVASEWLRLWIENYVEVDGGLRPRPDYAALASICPNTSVARAQLLAAGGFDENFPATQDLELGLRLRQRGVRPCFQPAAVAFLISIKNDRDLVLKDAVREGRDFVRLGRRHPAFRRDLPLARLGEVGPLRQTLLHAAAARPALFEPLLRVPYAIAERLRFLPAARRAGIRLLEHRRRVLMFHHAAAEAGSWEALQAQFGRRLPVLLYHHVGPPRPGANPSLTVPPAEFARQVAWLADRGFAGINAAQWWQWREQGTALPERPVLLTFDDGYADLDQHALPILRQYGFSATVFLVTSCLGKSSVWDQPLGWTPHPCLAEERIRHWAEQGIEFGAHSHTHPDLTLLPAGGIREETDSSARELQRILGRRSIAFAYPYGSYNSAVCAEVAGRFALAFTIHAGINGLSTDPHLLHRFWVFPGDTALDLRGRLRWGKSPLRGLRQRWQRLLARPQVDPNRDSVPGHLNT